MKVWTSMYIIEIEVPSQTDCISVRYHINPFEAKLVVLRTGCYVSVFSSSFSSFVAEGQKPITNKLS